MWEFPNVLCTSAANLPSSLAGVLSYRTVFRYFLPLAKLLNANSLSMILLWHGFHFHCETFPALGNTGNLVFLILMKLSVHPPHPPHYEVGTERSTTVLGSTTVCSTAVPQAATLQQAGLGSSTNT